MDVDGLKEMLGIESLEILPTDGGHAVTPTALNAGFIEICSVGEDNKSPDLTAILREAVIKALAEWEIQKLTKTAPTATAAGEIVSIGVDSCAGTTVWPNELCDDTPTEASPSSRAGRQFVPASKDGPRLPDRGRRKYVLKDRSNGTLRSINVNVTDVKKPLLAVADLNDKGYDVHFLRTKAYAEKGNGQRIDFIRRNCIFEYDVEVLPHTTFPGQPHV